MKLYRLAGWPELPSAYRLTAYRRMLHQMSQRPVSLHQLVRESGLQRRAVRDFLDSLSQQDMLIEGEHSPSLSLLGWLRRRKAAATPVPAR